MTNIEKFKEVFGFDSSDQICVMPKEVECPAEDCGQCEYGGFWYDEYKQRRVTGKWNSDQMNDWNVTQIDNRDAGRMDVTDEYYHEKYDTVSCPHCGCTLSAFVVMPFHYCYICGGQFGERKITYTEESEGSDADSN